MFRYILKRILWLIPILLGVTFIVFTIMYLSPGDPAISILGENAHPDAIAALRAEMGLDRPFLVQFLNYVYDVFVRFDFGRSYISNRVVLTEILSRLPNTIKLATLSIFFAALVGIPLGIISSTRPYSKVDNATMFVSLLGVSMPTFWQAPKKMPKIGPNTAVSIIGAATHRKRKAFAPIWFGGPFGRRAIACGTWWMPISACALHPTPISKRRMPISIFGG